MFVPVPEPGMASLVTLSVMIAAIVYRRRIAYRDKEGEAFAMQEYPLIKTSEGKGNELRKAAQRPAASLIDKVNTY